MDDSDDFRASIARLVDERTTLHLKCWWCGHEKTLMPINLIRIANRGLSEAVSSLNIRLKCKECGAKCPKRELIYTQPFVKRQAQR